MSENCGACSQSGRKDNVGKTYTTGRYPVSTQKKEGDSFELYADISPDPAVGAGGQVGTQEITEKKSKQEWKCANPKCPIAIDDLEETIRDLTTELETVGSTKKVSDLDEKVLQDIGSKLEKHRSELSHKGIPEQRKGDWESVEETMENFVEEFEQAKERSRSLRAKIKNKYFDIEECTELERLKNINENTEKTVERINNEIDKTQKKSIDVDKEQDIEERWEEGDVNQEQDIEERWGKRDVNKELDTEDIQK